MTIPTPVPVPVPLSATFKDDAYDFTVWMASAAPEFDAAAQTANDAAAVVAAGMPSIIAAANYKGLWTGLTGALAIPASTYHSGKFWQLLSNVADVTTKTPGVASEWVEFSSKPTVPTGNVVASGNLLAIDDSGNSLAVDSITTGILQAVVATSFHAVGLANGNTAIFWTASSTDYRMMVVDKTGAIVLASTSVATGSSSGFIWSCLLTNGNICIVYYNASNQPTFKIIDATGAQVVTPTVIEATTGTGQIKNCALTGGGFAVAYSNASGYGQYAIYTNAGAVTKAATTKTASAGQTSCAICPTAAGGFVFLSGSSNLIGNIYNAAGTSLFVASIQVSSGGDVNIASKSGSVVATGRSSSPATPTLHLASDTSATTINSNGTSGNVGGIAPTFSDGLGVGSVLAAAHIAVLGDGNYITTFAPYTTSTEFPRFVIFNENMQIIRSGICFTELTCLATYGVIYVIPKDTNGFSLIYLAPNRNIKFAQVKSGKVIGISAGQNGANTFYDTSGSATVTNGSMLNVGGSKINYSRQGLKVVI